MYVCNHYSFYYFSTLSEIILCWLGKEQTIETCNICLFFICYISLILLTMFQMHLRNICDIKKGGSNPF